MPDEMRAFRRLKMPNEHEGAARKGRRRVRILRFDEVKNLNKIIGRLRLEAPYKQQAMAPQYQPQYIHHGDHLSVLTSVLIPVLQ